jgi:glucose-1-phosphate thymidylyltransferase
VTARGATTQAVVLARGLGTRMRRQSGAPGTALNAVQARAAESGAKAMMPFARPFLDYVISALADAEISEVVLVIGPEHEEIREYYTTTAVPARVQIRFAVQQEPRGTADAVRAAQNSVRAAPFLLLNSDNYYPITAYSALAAVRGAGLVAFEAEALIRESGIEPERVLRYALIDSDADGWLRSVREKPPADDPLTRRAERWVSMNVWSFTPLIFDACARIQPSPRGELELADAVMTAVRELGERFRVIPMRAGVLDLSSRADVAFVAARLAEIEPRP